MKEINKKSEKYIFFAFLWFQFFLFQLEKLSGLIFMRNFFLSVFSLMRLVVKFKRDYYMIFVLCLSN